MSFRTTIARLREASHSHVPGAAPGSCRVSREDLRVALHVIDRLDADARRADRLTHGATDQPLSALDVGTGSGLALAARTRQSQAARNSIEVVLPFTASLGTKGELLLRHSDNFGDKAHLSIDVGHPLNGSKAGASLPVNSMHHSLMA